jgi:inward rectifier potassium channel
MPAPDDLHPVSPQRSEEEESARARNRRRTHVITLGKRRIVTHGLPRIFLQDIYHYAMTASWPQFFAAIGTLFLVLNGLFATVFLFGRDPIANILPDGFWGAFFFSVETLATVGYGDMHPQTMFGHIVATVEIFVGMSFIALFTGLMFARFSRPRARILFADRAVVGPVDGKKTLTIRAVNARQNVIVDASARLRLLRVEVTHEGAVMRKLHDLDLVREQHPIFALGWSIMHVIDESSILYTATPESLAAEDAALVLTIDGVDETTSQVMQSRMLYGSHEILWQHRYEDLLFTDEGGVDHIDYTRIHDTRAV